MGEQRDLDLRTGYTTGATALHVHCQYKPFRIIRRNAQH